MDPNAILNPEWTDIGDMLTYLWITVGLIVVFATNILIGHIAIPSLVETEHIPAKLQKARPLFYAAGVAAFGLAMFFLFLAVGEAGVIRRFWASYWI